MGEFLERWDGNPEALRPGRAVLLGFPQDEGVRRNHGRPGSSLAPAAIRQYLYRLTPWDGVTGTDLGQNAPLDLGDIRITEPLEATQEALGVVVGELLRRGAVPVVLGGGHETAYGHYLGYVHAGLPVAIVNLDAHLDVRPCVDGRGHSGSPFRQALEHPLHPLPGHNYTCLGVQVPATCKAHVEYVQSQGGTIGWASTETSLLVTEFRQALQRYESSPLAPPLSPVLGGEGLGVRGPVCPTPSPQPLSPKGARGEAVAVYLSVDADVVQVAEVPGVSAPNPFGVCGRDVARCARLAGESGRVRSIDLVEINPTMDRDDQSSRWAAWVLWHFLVGLAHRVHFPSVSS